MGRRTDRPSHWYYTGSVLKSALKMHSGRSGLLESNAPKVLSHHCSTLWRPSSDPTSIIMNTVIKVLPAGVKCTHRAVKCCAWPPFSLQTPTCVTRGDCSLTGSLKEASADHCVRDVQREMCIRVVTFLCLLSPESSAAGTCSALSKPNSLWE